MNLCVGYAKFGEWGAKPKEPRVKVTGDSDGCIEVCGEPKMMRIGKYSNDTIEYYFLPLADGSGFVMGWNTTYLAKKVLDSFVTDVDEKPVIVNPLPPEEKPRPQKPKPPPPDKDAAAKKIQQAAKDRAERKKNPKPKPKKKKKEEKPKTPPKLKLKKFKADRVLYSVDGPETNKRNGKEIPANTVFEVTEEKTVNDLNFANLADGSGWVCIAWKDANYAEKVV